MATELLDNSVSKGTTTTLSEPLSASDTILQTRGPASVALQAGGGQFRVIIINPSTGDMELALVTDGAWTAQWNVQRGIEGTEALDFPEDSIVKHIFTSGALFEVIRESASSVELTRINPVLPPYNADPTGNIDSTAAFAAAYADGPVDIPLGTYLILGLLDISGSKDFLGTGMDVCKFIFGANGQIRVGFGGGSSGGRIGNFEGDGQGIQNRDGGAYYVTGRNYVKHENMLIYNTVRECGRCDGGQNHSWDNVNFGSAADSARVEVPFIWDHATGGHDLDSCEPAGGYRIQQTHKDYSGGYFTWVGPSDIHYRGGRTEYTTAGHPLVHHAAGSSISLHQFGIAGGDPSSVVTEPGAQNYPLATPNVTAWDGGFNITVDDVSGITGLMSAKVPTCKPETIVTSVVGNVVTLSVAPTVSPIGQQVAFGARCLDLTVEGPGGIGGTAGVTNGFDMRGATTVNLVGRSLIQNHLNAFLMRASDQVYKLGANPKFQGVTNEIPQQQPDDTAPFNSGSRVVSAIRGPLVVTTLQDGTVSFQQNGDAFPYMIIKRGLLLVSNGAVIPVNVGLAYQQDGDGTEHAYIAGSSVRSQFSFEIIGDGATFIGSRWRSRLNGIGPPVTPGTAHAGDFCVDMNGSVFNCIAEDPDLWVDAASRRISQTLAANGAITFDAAAANIQGVTLQANATSSAVINAKSGQRMTIRWLQDATGGRTYAWPTNWKFAPGVVNPVSGANQWQASTAVYDGVNWNEVSRSGSFVSLDPAGVAADLSGTGGTTNASGQQLGDKIALYQAAYGFGVQTNRLVAFTATGAGVGFAVRKASAGGNKSSGSDAVLLGNDGGVVSTYLRRGKATPAYSASITPDAALGPWQTITVANATAFTINPPLNPPSSSQAAELTVEVFNNSGGAMGAITWNAVFVFAGQVWVNPASTKRRFARFEWNGANWICTSMATADY